jgi:hypothetical protein
MENFYGYVIINEYSSGSKSDGYVAYLFISPNKIYKLYRVDVLPVHDTYFNEFHLKYVELFGELNQRFRSIKVETIKSISDPFFNDGSKNDFNLNEEEKI